jgi:hypothetical protein
MSSGSAARDRRAPVGERVVWKLTFARNKSPGIQEFSMRGVKLVIWGSVVLWWLLPPLWLAVTMGAAVVDRATEKKAVKTTAETPSYPSATDTYFSTKPTGKDFGLTVLLGGYVTLAALFGYGVWCACGTVCGFGAEKTAAAVSEFFAKKRVVEVKPRRIVQYQVNHAKPPRKRVEQ